LHAIKTNKGNGDIAPLILDLSTIWLRISTIGFGYMIPVTR